MQGQILLKHMQRGGKKHPRGAGRYGKRYSNRIWSPPALTGGNRKLSSAAGCSARATGHSLLCPWAHGLPSSARHLLPAVCLPGSMASHLPAGKHNETVPLLQREQEALRKADGICLQHLLPTPGLPSVSPGDNFSFLQADVFYHIPSKHIINPKGISGPIAGKRVVWTSLEPGQTVPSSPPLASMTIQGSLRHGFTQTLLPLYSKHHKIYTQKKGRMRRKTLGSKEERLRKRSINLDNNRKQPPWSTFHVQADGISTTHLPGPQEGEGWA